MKLVEERLRPGDIVLCHDIHPGTLEAVTVLADKLPKLGFTLVTVSTLLKACNRTALS